MPQSPLVIFAYNRPDHLASLLHSLKLEIGNEPRDLHVFVDGPKSEIDSIKVQQVVGLLENYSLIFPKLTIHKQNQNQGLSFSIQNGLSFIFSNYEAAIILEDDLIIGPGSISYFDRALKKYKEHELVASISGYQYIADMGVENALFLRGADCWGWATWKSRWDEVSFDSRELLQQIKRKSLVKEFDFQGAANFTELLKLNSVHRIDSWAVCWHASMFLLGKFTLYPPFSLISNIGGDGSGTHPSSLDFQQDISNNQRTIVLPDSVQESSYFKLLMYNFYKENYLQRGFWRRYLHRLRLLWWEYSHALTGK
jgi:hypothetical protein